MDCKRKKRNRLKPILQGLGEHRNSHGSSSLCCCFVISFEEEQLGYETQGGSEFEEEKSD